jgi:hypothetical protein
MVPFNRGFLFAEAPDRRHKAFVPAENLVSI